MVKLTLKENEKIIQIRTLTNKNLYFKYTTGTKTLDDVIDAVYNKIKYAINSHYNVNKNDLKFIIDYQYWPDDFKYVDQYQLLNDTQFVKLTNKYDIFEYPGKYEKHEIIHKKIHQIKQKNTFEPLDDLVDFTGYICDSSKPYQIFVKTLVGKTKCINVDLTDTIGELKEKIGEIEKISMDKQCLIFAGKQLLNDNQTLSGYGLRNESTVHLVLNLRGGMFMEVSGRNGKYEPLENLLYDLDNNEFMELID